MLSSLKVLSRHQGGGKGIFGIPLSVKIFENTPLEFLVIPDVWSQANTCFI